MRLMLLVPRKTTHHFGASSRCPGLSDRSRWEGCLSSADSPVPALPLARPQTELFALGPAAGKGGSARSEPACGGIRPPVASAQRSQQHFGRPARLVGVCRATLPIRALPARSCLIHPDVRAPLRDLWRAAKDSEPMQTDYRQNFAKYSLPGEAYRGRDSPLGASYLRRSWHRFHSSDLAECGRLNSPLICPPSHLRGSPAETSSRTALLKRLWLGGSVWEPDSVCLAREKLARLAPCRRSKSKLGVEVKPVGLLGKSRDHKAELFPRPGQAESSGARVRHVPLLVAVISRASPLLFD